MIEPQFTAERGSGLVRLFPLPGVVLLPHGMMQLHTFEPRYRKMTADALDGDRQIAMAVPTGKGAELHDYACLGRILHERRTSDGRFHFMLRGECRVKLVHEYDSDLPYRTARAVLVADETDPVAAQRRGQRRERILAAIRKLLPADSEVVQTLLEFLTTDCDSSAFADIVGYTVPLNPRVKRRLLGTASVDRRLELLIAALRAVRTEQPPQEAGRTFPPEFSVN